MDKTELPFSSMVYCFLYMVITWEYYHLFGKFLRSNSYILINSKATINFPQFFATHRMKFIDRYSRNVTIPKYILHNIYSTLTNDSSAAVSNAQQTLDWCIDETISMDKPEILLDLRKFNGDVKSNYFWDELGIFIEEINAVDERRHSSILHMPVVVSHHLRNTIEERLQKKYPTDQSKQLCQQIILQREGFCWL